MVTLRGLIYNFRQGDVDSTSSLLGTGLGTMQSEDWCEKKQERKTGTRSGEIRREQAPPLPPVPQRFRFI